MLYRLPEVIEAIGNGQMIAIVEGEKDADNLWRIGIAATCNAHGATERARQASRNGRRHIASNCASADIVVLNDNDAAGYAHADTAAQALARHRQARATARSGNALGRTCRTRRDVQRLARRRSRRRRTCGVDGACAGLCRHNQAGESRRGRQERLHGKNTDWACNVGNVLLASKEPEIMKRSRSTRCCVPGAAAAAVFTTGTNFKPRPVTDADVCAVQNILQWLGFRRLGKDVDARGCQQARPRSAFHPVRDYLDGCGVGRTINRDSEHGLAIISAPNR